MEYKIITTCHPKDREGKKTFIRLIEKLKTCRRKLAADMVTVDDCREIFVIFELKKQQFELLTRDSSNIIMMVQDDWRVVYV